MNTAPGVVLLNFLCILFGIKLVLVTLSRFHFCLIFEGNAGAYPSEALSFINLGSFEFNYEVKLFFSFVSFRQKAFFISKNFTQVFYNNEQWPWLYKITVVT